MSKNTQSDIRADRMKWQFEQVAKYSNGTLVEPVQLTESQAYEVQAIKQKPPSGPSR